MFEQVIYRRALRPGGQIDDVGLLAEVLLFYRSVHLLLDHGALVGLLKSVSPDDLVALLASGHATASFLKNSNAVHTETINGVPTHNFITFQLTGHVGFGEYDKEKRFETLIERATGAKPTKRTVRRLLDKMRWRSINDGCPDPRGVSGLAHDDALDSAYASQAALRAIQACIPGYIPAPGSRFVPIETGKGLLIDTNLDFSEINSTHAGNMWFDNLTPALVLEMMMSARTDMFISAKHMSELVTNPWSADLIQLKFSELLAKRAKNSQEIETFQQMTLEDGRALREAINNGTRSFSDFLKLLDEAQKFKDWLAKANPDSDLLAEYFRSVNAISWINKLAPKHARFGVMALGGAALEYLNPSGLGAGLALVGGYADQFYLDKLLRGWRPDHFIERKLTPFVQGDQ